MLGNTETRPLNVMGPYTQWPRPQNTSRARQGRVSPLTPATTAGLIAAAAAVVIGHCVVPVL